MKTKVLSLLLTSTICIAPAFGKNVDESLFLEPHLSTLAGKIAFHGGEQLPAEKMHTFEHAVSMNIGMHLPSTTHVVSEENCKMVGLGAHMRTLADSLKENGQAIITAPASFGVVFTTGKNSQESVMQSIATALEKIGTSEDPSLIVSTLSELKDVARASFVRREGKLQLVSDEKMLSLGEPVWRKTQDGVEAQVYHSEEEYLVAIQNAGLTCEEIKRPCFFGEVKWKAYNNSVKDDALALGTSYIEHNPFTIYCVTKKG